MGIYLTIAQPTDLFCHFRQINIFIRFNPLSCKYWGNTLPHGFSVEQGHAVPPKVWGKLFLKKLFRADGVTNLFGQTYGGRVAVIYCELVISSYQGLGSSTNALSSSLKTVNLKKLSNNEGINTEGKALTSLWSCGRIYSWNQWLGGFKGCVMFSLTLTYYLES